MAVFGEVKSITFQAGGDLSDTLYHILRTSGADQVNIASHAAAAFAVGAAGVQQSRADSGQNVSVGVMGESKVVAGAAITVNNLITTNGSGRAVAATSGDLVVGRALVAAANDGEVIRALIQPVWRLNGAV